MQKNKNDAGLITLQMIAAISSSNHQDGSSHHSDMNASQGCQLFSPCGALDPQMNIKSLKYEVVKQDKLNINQSKSD